MSIAEALREALREEMRRDERVFCIGEDIDIPGGFGGAFTVTLGLAEEFGTERVRNTPISEAGFIGAAVGAAVMGLRPVADVQYSDFLFCAMDQIVTQAAKLRYMSGGQVSVPMVLRAPVGSTARGAQHSHSPEGYFIHCPGWKVVAPSTAYDAKGLLKSAIRDDNPVLVFEHKLLYGSKGARKEPGGIDAAGEVPEEEYLVPIGVAEVKRPGSDVTVVAKLLMLHRAMAAAQILAQEGISVEVIDPRTLVPIDEKTILDSVRKTGRLVVVDEDNRTGSWASEVVTLVAEQALDYLDKPPLRICAPDTPSPFSPPLEGFYVPSTERITQGIRSLVS